MPYSHIIGSRLFAMSFYNLFVSNIAEIVYFIDNQRCLPACLITIDNGKTPIIQLYIFKSN